MMSVAPRVSGSMTSLRNVISSSILAAENILRLGLIALVSLWIAHQLGPQNFGVLNYASAILAVFWSMSLLGMDTPLVARLTHTQQPGELLGSAIAVRVAAGLIGMVLVMGVIAWTRQGDPTAVLVGLIIALSIPLSAPMVLDAWFKATNQALPAASARVIATLASCAAKVGCLMMGWGLVGLAVTVALEGLLTALALWVAYRKCRIPDIASRLSVTRAQVTQLFHDCWPFFLSTAAIAAYMKIDVILLGILSDNRETGLYSLSQKLTETLYMLPVVVSEVLYPQLVREHRDLSVEPTSATQTFFDLIVGVAIVATIAGAVVVWWLVPALFGESYRRSAEVFQLHAWSCVGVGLAHARFKWLAAAGFQSLAPVITLASLALSAMLNLVLIPEHGAMGAAAATVISHTAGALGLTLLFRQTRPIAAMQWRALWPWGRLYRQMRQA